MPQTRARAAVRQGGGDQRSCALYVIAQRHDDGWRGPCKIGISADPQSRVRNLQTGSPSPLGLYAIIAGTRGLTTLVERKAHRIHRNERLAGEWFAIEPENALLSLMCGLVALARHDRSIRLDDLDSMVVRFSAGVPVAGFFVRPETAHA